MGPTAKTGTSRLPFPTDKLLFHRFMVQIPPGFGHWAPDKWAPIRCSPRTAEFLHENEKPILPLDDEFLPPANAPAADACHPIPALIAPWGGTAAKTPMAEQNRQRIRKGTAGGSLFHRRSRDACRRRRRSGVTCRGRKQAPDRSQSRRPSRHSPVREAQSWCWELISHRLKSTRASG
jgi:hypothetical protein